MPYTLATVCMCYPPAPTLPAFMARGHVQKQQQH